MSDHPQIRVGHADRDAVIERLQAAAAEGCLTVEELEERIEAAAAAKFHSDLEPLVADLPGAELAVPAAAAPPVRRDPGHSPDDPLWLEAGMSDERRWGVWHIPPWIAVKPSMSTVMLNCLEAIPPPGGIITLHINPGLGTTRLIVPEGWGCESDRLHTGSLGVKKILVPDRPAPGGVHVRVEGRTGSSTFVIRTRRWWDRWHWLS